MRSCRTVVCLLEIIDLRRQTSEFVVISSPQKRSEQLWQVKLKADLLHSTVALPVK